MAGICVSLALCLVAGIGIFHMAGATGSGRASAGSYITVRTGDTELTVTADRDVLALTQLLEELTSTQTKEDMPGKQQKPSVQMTNATQAPTGTCFISVTHPDGTLQEYILAGIVLTEKSQNTRYYLSAVQRSQLLQLLGL